MLKKCMNPYNGQNKKVSGHMTTKPCRNLYTAISVNKHIHDWSEHAYIHIYIYIYTHTANVQWHVLYTHMHMRARTHAHTPTHTHTHTFSILRHRNRMRNQKVFYFWLQDYLAKLQDFIIILLGCFVCWSTRRRSRWNLHKPTKDEDNNGWK